MKKSHKMNRIVIDPSDLCFLNHKEEFELADFTYDIPDEFADVVVDYLNYLRVEWVSYRYNGEPKSKYKPEVREKINHKKDEKLKKKEDRALTMMKYTGLEPNYEYRKDDE